MSHALQGHTLFMVTVGPGKAATVEFVHPVVFVIDTLKGPVAPLILNVIDPLQIPKHLALVEPNMFICTCVKPVRAIAEKSNKNIFLMFSV